MMRRFAGNVLASTLALTLLVGSLSSAGAQAAESIATPSRPAILPVRVERDVPADAVLHLWISAFAPPRRGAVEAVVSLNRGSGEAVEVGRIAVYPSEPFRALRPAEERGYSFDAADALSRLRSAQGNYMVRVALEAIDATTSSDGSLSVSRAELKARP